MFMMDPIAKFIYTAIFLAIIGGLTYFGIRVFILKMEIRDLNSTITEQKINISELNKSLEECRAATIKLESSNSFLNENIRRLKEYYKQKPKPPVVSGTKFNIENLFMVSPR